jgi:alpha-glucosidase (family GH31 glycosyl hydrolase)
LLNYIYNAAVIAHESGIPIMRSMPVAFPDEGPLAAVRDQYMFGEDLLVAPVINEHNSRAILFPSGVWTNLWNGKTVSGPANVKVDVLLDEIPVYLKPGAVVPVQLNQKLQFGESMTGNKVAAFVVTPPNGNASVSRLNTKGEVATVTIQSNARGFAWTLANFPETNYLLVYGRTNVKAVRVNGKVLPKQTTSTGWEVDAAGSRVVIHLPSGQAQPNSGTKVEVDFNS